MKGRWSISGETDVTDPGADTSYELPLFIVGPCGLESRETALQVASSVSSLMERFSPSPLWVFKSSFLKDNRSLPDSWAGPGLEEGLRILEEVSRDFGVRILTDIHLPEQAGPVAEVVDILQVPAFLCRQTSILEAAGRTGLPVNVKKGQFMDPAGMGGAAEKLRRAGAAEVWLTERGTFFGYGDLVVDLRSLALMAPLADRVILDVTHSLQKPGADGGSSGGCREFAPFLARAGAAWGVDGLFIEAHPDPGAALSDHTTMVDLDTLGVLIEGAVRHWEGRR